MDFLFADVRAKANRLRDRLSDVY